MSGWLWVTPVSQKTLSFDRTNSARKTAVGKLVIFNFGYGNFDQGFSVTLRIGEDGQPPYTEISGGLPSAPEIPQQYSRWQSAYCQLGDSRVVAPRIEVPPAQLTNYSSKEECNSAAQIVLGSLNRWLRQEPFLDLRERLLEQIRRDDPVRFILQTQNMQIRRLPWNQCDLFKRYSRAEIALSAADYEPRRSTIRGRLRILAILGNSDGIDVRADRALLQQLPGAKVTLLEKPQRLELNEKLWTQNWDILFFAGHSSSQNEGEQGQLQLNDTDSLTLEELNYALGRAVNNGLKLAIFNSCDGLGLAWSLQDLHIPQVIVMREPVPDRVAQAFLKYFLRAFAGGEPFYMAVRQAREQLQGMEDEFPYATWLPVICQNPAEVPMTWPHRWLLKVGLLLSGVAIAVVVALKIGETPPRFSLGERILMTEHSNREKQAGVNAFAAKDFATAADKFESSLRVNPNDPEALIYLNNAKAARTGHTLKIATSVPIGGNLGNAQEILRGIAQAQDEVNHSGGINGALLEVEIVNDDNQPEIAVQKVAPKLIEDRRILAVVGHDASDVSIAAATVYQKGGLVMISPTSSTMELSAVGSHIFRSVPSVAVPREADNLSRYAIKTARRTKFAICIDSRSSYSTSLKREFMRAVFQGRGRVSAISCDFSDPNFNPSDFVAKAIADGVDGLLLAPSVNRIDHAIRVAKASKGRLALFGGSSMYTYEVLQLGQVDVNGMVVAVVWHPEATPEKSFPKKAAQLWGGAVNWRTATAYDATQAIVMGLKQNSSRSGLQKALSSPGFRVQGATGKVEFLPSGDRLPITELGLLVRVQPVANSPFGYGFAPMQP